MSDQEKELIGLRECGTMVLEGEEDVFKRHWLSNAGYDPAVDKWCENESHGERVDCEEKSNVSEKNHTMSQSGGDCDTLSGDPGRDGK